MEIISPSQLCQYEAILDDIKAEYEKCANLRKSIQIEEDKIVISQLARVKTHQKISHVSVKVFNTIWEIHNLYSSDLENYNWEMFKQDENCKFYLLEVFIADCLLSKLMQCQCKVHINLQSNDLSIAKSVTLANQSRFFEIIAVDEKAENCRVKSTLFIPFDPNPICIDLPTIPIGISHHFEAPIKGKSPPGGKLDNKLLNIAKLYGNCHGLQSVVRKSEFSCENMTTNSFIDDFLQHSYHRFPLEAFSDLLNFKFSVFRHKISISFSEERNFLQIKSPSVLMGDVLKFFLKYSKWDEAELKIKLKEIINKRNSPMIDFNEIIDLYHDFRNIWR